MFYCLSCQFLGLLFWIPFGSDCLVQVNVEDLQDGTHRRLQANQESNRDIEIIGILSCLYDLKDLGSVSGW